MFPKYARSGVSRLSTDLVNKLGHHTEGGTGAAMEPYRAVLQQLSGLAVGGSLRCALGLILGLAMQAVGIPASAHGQHTAEQHTFELSLEHGAFSYKDLPNAVVHDPRSTAERNHGPLEVVVFLHGFRGCARAQMASRAVACGKRHPRVQGRALAEAHMAANAGTVLVIPQLRLLARDGSPGRFARTGGFRHFIQELCAEMAPHWGPDAFSRIARIVLVAHSAGYRTALSILKASDLPELVRDVVLFDALYLGVDGFAAWVDSNPHHRLVCIHGKHGKPARNAARLVRLSQRHGTSVVSLSPAQVTEIAANAWPTFQIATAKVQTPHANFPRIHTAAVLRHLLGP